MKIIAQGCFARPGLATQPAAGAADAASACAETRLIVPAYFGENDARWKAREDLLKKSPESSAAVIVNPASGPAAKRGIGIEVQGNQDCYNQ